MNSEMLEIGLRFEFNKINFFLSSVDVIFAIHISVFAGDFQFIMIFFFFGDLEFRLHLN